MTVLAALQKAAIRLVGRKPQTVFESTGNFEIEIADMVNEVARDIAQYQDWQALTRIATITGDGTTTEFDLPADYDRMVVNNEVLDSAAWFWGYHRFPTVDTFLLAEQSGFTGVPGGWVIYDDAMRFAPAPATASTARFVYITKNIVRSESTAGKEEFTADTDTFVLPERLLTLGVVWRWRENKKLDAAGDQEAFIKALDEYAGKDGGGPAVIRRNSRNSFRGAHLAWPWELGPSTYIDS